MENNTVTLAIEAAVAGGSLALFQGGALIGSRPGDADVSRAETLLPQIAEMFSESNVDKTDISRIAVSLGPGSFTGIRIGVATALGLKNGLGVPCHGISSLKAIAYASEGSLIAAVPVGKSDVAWQEFGDKRSTPVSDDHSLFLEFLGTRTGTRLFLHSLLIERLGADLDAYPVTDIGTDLASPIARAVIGGEGSEDLTPIYLRNSRYTGVG
ncbi:MAG TPA: tRNA (adenosine(37)-N6)-threonylcarbamoyltransferase complex dimerization subunit type 1 TsaB [Pyrinomonadaceae bacterium]|nr:tRNA (adenosine(37)-N6)-threonylcarbamoyltransferase complex dimerization subunit type 1 TsaB [Pyrinomonadaceae bacterium]